MVEGKVRLHKEGGLPREKQCVYEQWMELFLQKYPMDNGRNTPKHQLCKNSRWDEMSERQTIEWEWKWIQVIRFLDKPNRQTDRREDRHRKILHWQVWMRKGKGREWLISLKDLKMREKGKVNHSTITLRWRVNESAYLPSTEREFPTL